MEDILTDTQEGINRVRWKDPSVLFMLNVMPVRTVSYPLNTMEMLMRSSLSNCDTNLVVN